MQDTQANQLDALNAILMQAVKSEASDVHLCAEHVPTMRRHGQLQAISEDVLGACELTDLLMAACPTDRTRTFDEQRSLDFAHQIIGSEGRHRFRANYFFTQGVCSACFRHIPQHIPSFEWSGFPESLAQRLTQFTNGLVLVTGVTGSGKTTTLAMLTNMFNQQGGYRIITIEDPIEYIFPRGNHSIVTQREVGRDVPTFGDGLKFGLRQDPDVILVGEIRDRDTAQMALSAAETGHLVLATMHTRDAKGAISRYSDFFPQSVQNEIRGQLAMGLRCVISQHLLDSAVQGQKRELAMEIMFNNLAIASAIRFGKIETIDNSIKTGKADGMMTLDDSLKLLYHSQKISAETVRRLCSDPQILGAPAFQ